jgi:hypothetical protein
MPVCLSCITAPVHQFLGRFQETWWCFDTSKRRGKLASQSLSAGWVGFRRPADEFSSIFDMDLFVQMMSMPHSCSMEFRDSTCHLFFNSPGMGLSMLGVSDHVQMMSMPLTILQWNAGDSELSTSAEVNFPFTKA